MSYSINQNGGEWIVCVDGNPMVTCADREMALRIIAAAAANQMAEPADSRFIALRKAG